MARSSSMPTLAGSMLTETSTYHMAVHLLKNLSTSAATIHSIVQHATTYKGTDEIDRGAYGWVGGVISRSISHPNTSTETLHTILDSGQCPYGCLQFMYDHRNTTQELKNKIGREYVRQQDMAQKAQDLRRKSGSEFHPKVEWNSSSLVDQLLEAPDDPGIKFNQSSAFLRNPNLPSDLIHKVVSDYADNPPGGLLNSPAHSVAMGNHRYYTSLIFKHAIENPRTHVHTLDYMFQHESCPWSELSRILNHPNADIELKNKVRRELKRQKW